MTDQAEIEITPQTNDTENDPLKMEIEPELTSTNASNNIADNPPTINVTEEPDDQAAETKEKQEIIPEPNVPDSEKTEEAGEVNEQSQIDPPASPPKVEENAEEQSLETTETKPEAETSVEQGEEGGKKDGEEEKISPEIQIAEADEMKDKVSQPEENQNVENVETRPEDEDSVVVLSVPEVDATPLPVEDELPQPGTPDQPGSVKDEEEENLMAIDEQPEPEYNRDELVEQYQAVVQERDQLNQKNRSLQHKLSEYFRKKKTDDVRQEVEKTTIDQEQRYMKYMSNLEELRQQQIAETEEYNEVVDELKAKKSEKQARVEEEWKRAVEFKRGVAMEAINSRSGRSIPLKDIEMYEMNEEKKEAEVAHVRLENIKLKNRLKKQEGLLRQKEELAEGLHLIDFEQLKIENQTYNEKIEERNEELLKLRKKITTTVQVLTHLKEKLQFVQAENSQKKELLAEVEKEVAQKRDILSRTKQARDSLRHDNNKLQQKCGLLGNVDLLRDFEVSTDEVTDLEHKLDMLRRTHAELTLSLNGIKKKIEMARENQS